jgi:CheY-like chemotaxis protein
MSNKDREILLVDDDCDEHYLFRESIAQVDPEIEIKSFLSGQEFFDYLKGGTPDRACCSIVMLDLNMSGLGGHEVLQWIRDNEQFASMPVIIYSNSQAPEDIRRSYRYGANAHMTKALNEKESVRDISRLVDFWFGTACLC